MGSNLGRITLTDVACQTIGHIEISRTPLTPSSWPILGGQGSDSSAAGAVAPGQYVRPRMRHIGLEAMLFYRHPPGPRRFPARIANLNGLTKGNPRPPRQKAAVDVHRDPKRVAFAPTGAY